MIRVGLLGGTFDPLHNGHVSLAQAAMESGRIDRLIIMVSGQPPHKSGQVVQMAGYRFDMACRAFAGWPNTEVSDLEILRDGPSYTIRTIRQLKADGPKEMKLSLIYGADILRDIEHWHKPEQILAECELLLAQRPGYEQLESETLAKTFIDRWGARISFFDSPRIDLSSTMIRQSAADGNPCRQWLPEPVVQTIRHNALYKWQRDLKLVDPAIWPDLIRYERRLWTVLSQKRLLHSLNVMTYAIHLAHLHHVDVRQAAIAALLHDCAKDLPMDKIDQYAVMAEDPSLSGSELGHGPAGAWLAKTLYGVEDKAILRAIHYHTTGCAGMTALDKIIFIADKVEPARTYDHLEQIRALVETDLDAALRITLDEIDAFLKRENLDTHPYTLTASDEVDCRLD